MNDELKDALLKIFQERDIDRIITPQEMAVLIGVEPRQLCKYSQGRNPKIPAIRISAKVVRYHIRSVLAKLALDSGLSIELVGAMFGGVQRRLP